MRLLRTASALAALLIIPVLPAIRASGPHTSGVSQEPPTFRSRANLVLLQVSVFEGRSSAVQNLSPTAFHVYEDGVEQAIQFFAAREVPLAAGLVIDNSSSMLTRREMVRAGVRAFAESSHDADELFTIVFNEHVRSGLPPTVSFTHSRELLLSALALHAPGGLTALHDAIIEGLSRLADASLQKRVLVVLTDGKDNASTQSESNMLYRASQSSALIYPIATHQLAPDGGNPRVLKQLAERTGGVVYTPRSERDVVDAFTRVAANIRHGYSIGYIPTNTATDGAYRRVRVTVTVPGRRLDVRTRDGYIGPDTVDDELPRSSEPRGRDAARDPA